MTWPSSFQRCCRPRSKCRVVRVIEYALPGSPDGKPRYRLLTTLLDPAVAPALELAALKAVFDALKTLRDLSPPECPRLRVRWFTQLLEAGDKLRATRTIGKQSPGMLKRRNSPYACHDRKFPTRVAIDCTPRCLKPPPLSPSYRHRSCNTS